jgi:NAD-dependent deacetylase
MIKQNQIIDLEKIIIITGAGICMESGILPFRGKNGLLNENPMKMAIIAKFVSEPALFYSTILIKIRWN